MRTRINDYTVDHTTDEFGNDRYFVANPSCDWVDGPYDSIDQANDRAFWRNRKVEGTRVRFLLEPLPAGTEFRLTGGSRAAHESRAGGYLVGAMGVGRAYVALYRKNEDGTWNQVPGTCEPPHVINMDAEHLGFCVGEEPVRQALKDAGYSVAGILHSTLDDQEPAHVHQDETLHGLGDYDTEGGV